MSPQGEDSIDLHQETQCLKGDVGRWRLAMLVCQAHWHSSIPIVEFLLCLMGRFIFRERIQGAAHSQSRCESKTSAPGSMMRLVVLVYSNDSWQCILHSLTCLQSNKLPGLIAFTNFMLAKSLLLTCRGWWNALFCLYELEVWMLCTYDILVYPLQMWQIVQWFTIWGWKVLICCRGCLKQFKSFCCQWPCLHGRTISW